MELPGRTKSSQESSGKGRKLADTQFGRLGKNVSIIIGVEDAATHPERRQCYILGISSARRWALRWSSGKCVPGNGPVNRTSQRNNRQRWQARIEDGAREGPVCRGFVDERELRWIDRIRPRLSRFELEIDCSWLLSVLCKNCLFARDVEGVMKRTAVHRYGAILAILCDRM